MCGQKTVGTMREKYRQVFVRSCFNHAIESKSY
jgi:hypothetical protein